MSAFSVASVRQNYAGLEQFRYLNTGTVGLMSETVLEKHLEYVSAYERGGHFAEEAARAGYEQARHTLSALINADPSEVALTRNATDGINYVLHGLEIESGATIVTTDQEHPAVLLPLRILAAQRGVTIRLLSLDGPDEQILEQFRSILSESNTRIAILSHVSCETGRRLPIRDLCSLCREYDALSLVDGAQSVGQFDVDVPAIGCDFMTGNGHKWLCGPKGTGFLYLRRELVPSVLPAYVGDGSVEPRFDRLAWNPNDPGDGWSLRDDAQRFEFGTRNWHMYAAITDAVEQLESWNRVSIQEHVASLTGELKADLNEIPAVTVHTPEEWTDSCGLVTFSVQGWEGTELSSRLWSEFSIVQRRVQVPSAVRISCAHFTDRSDLRELLDALHYLVQH